MDVRKAATKIAEETNTDMVTAEIMAENLTKVHSDLKEIVDSWLDGQELPFEYRGVSLERIMHRNNCRYVHAIFCMSSILRDPKLAEGYLRPQIIQ